MDSRKTNFEATIKQLISRQAVRVVKTDDFNKQTEAIIPKTKFNICYLVAGVLFNKEDEVLMMQEAKKSCHGEWYLPAGRVEPGENFREAVMREVQQETGLEFEPTTLLSFEFGGGHWYRLTFTGQVTGGRLKTEKDADAESLQAKWIKFDEIKQRNIPIRTLNFQPADIIPLIEIGIHHRQTSDQQPFDIMPVIQPHNQMILRCVIVKTSTSGNLNILMNTNGGVHFPSVIISTQDMSANTCVNRIFKYAFSQISLSDCKPDTCGVLSIEHYGIPSEKHDGMCLTILLTVTSKSDSSLDAVTTDYAWCSIHDPELIQEIKTLIDKKKCVPFINRH